MQTILINNNLLSVNVHSVAINIDSFVRFYKFKIQKIDLQMEKLDKIEL